MHTEHDAMNFSKNLYKDRKAESITSPEGDYLSGWISSLKTNVYLSPYMEMTEDVSGCGFKTINEER